MPIDSSSTPYSDGELEVNLDDAGSGAAGKAIDPLDEDLESAGKGAGAAEPIDFEPGDKRGTVDELDTDDGGGKTFDPGDDTGADGAILDDPGADDDPVGKFDLVDDDLDVDDDLVGKVGDHLHDHTDTIDI